MFIQVSLVRAETILGKWEEIEEKKMVNSVLKRKKNSMVVNVVYDIA